MNKEKKIIIANWKMNPQTKIEAEKLFKGIKKTAGKMRNVQTVVCPSFVHLSPLARIVSGHRCVVGAQDIFYEKRGAYTGEVSADMLASLGTKYALVGHSERRTLGETDEMVNKKLRATLAKKIIPVLCIGELDRAHEHNYFHMIKKQLSLALGNVPKLLVPKIIVAYEPLWAIGKKSKREATPAEVLEMKLFIQKVLADLYTGKVAKQVPILYGGSVNTKKEVEGFLGEAELDGLLVGRASLSARTFENILQTANDL